MIVCGLYKKNCQFIFYFLFLINVAFLNILIGIYLPKCQYQYHQLTINEIINTPLNRFRCAACTLAKVAKLSCDQLKKIKTKIKIKIIYKHNFYITIFATCDNGTSICVFCCHVSEL